MEINHIVRKRPVEPPAALSPPPIPVSVKREIQKVTFEMSRLFNEPSFKTSEDIPDVIEPHLNSLTQRQLRLADAKLIFEMKMAEAEDPDAPPIKIFNPIEGDKEPCPPFEFIYTNEMYHDKETGGPDHKNLKGCDCVGACDPNSKTCSCVIRQEYWTADVNNPHSNGFAYESDGRMKDGLQSYPIFECNWKCGCDETCTNRVNSLVFGFHITSS
jgi:[histone H3]-lysine9 N-trimethyltransferase SUV39H